MCQKHCITPQTRFYYVSHKGVAVVNNLPKAFNNGGQQLYRKHVPVYKDKHIKKEETADEIESAHTGTVPTQGEIWIAENLTGKVPLVKVNETICLVGPRSER